MKPQYITSLFVIFISVSACVPTPRPPTPTTIPIVVETSTPLPTLEPTEIPSPTNAPPPFVEITDPDDNGTVGCINAVEESFCLFNIEGGTGGVDSFIDYRIYVFVFPVNPPGEGWYLQNSPAAIETDGNWAQSPSYIGNVKVPAVTGHTLRIRAALVMKDSTLNGETLASLSGVTVLSAIEEIDGIVALSDIVDLTLAR